MKFWQLLLEGIHRRELALTSVAPGLQAPPAVESPAVESPAVESPAETPAVESPAGTSTITGAPLFFAAAFLSLFLAELLNMLKD